MWVRPRFALALFTVLASASAAQAGPSPQTRHGGVSPAAQPQAPGTVLQIPLGHAPLRVSQPMQPMHPLTSPQHKAEQQPSTVPGYNPLKRRHMAMPVLPGEDGSELAF